MGKNKIKQIGGSVLGKGGFGCVIKPYIPCNNSNSNSNYKKNNKKNKKSGKVSKILFKDMSKSEINIFENELQIAKILSKLDPKKKYFCPHDNICRLEKERTKNRKNITSVKFRRLLNNSGSQTINYREFRKSTSKIYRKERKNNTNDNTCRIDFSLHPINIIMPNCGIVLNKILKSVLDKSTLFKNTTQHENEINQHIINNNSNEQKYSNEKIYFKIGIIIKNNFRIFVKKLLIGLKIMHENYIIHHDIKPGNILINIENKELYVRIIDYNLSEYYPPEIQIKPFNELFKLIGSTSGTQWFIPPEVYGIKYSREIHLEYLYKNYSHKHIAAYILKKLTNNFIYYCAKSNLDLSPFNYNNENKHLLEEEIYYVSNQLYNDVLNGDNESIYNFIKKKYFGIPINSKTNITNGWWYKFDIFSTGLTIYKTAHDLGIDIKTNILLLDLLRNMLYINPDKRFNILQCLSHPFITTK